MTASKGRRLLGWAAGLAPAWLFAFYVVKDYALVSLRNRAVAGFFVKLWSIIRLILPFSSVPSFTGTSYFNPPLWFKIVAFAILAQAISKLVSRKSTFHDGLLLGVVCGVLVALPEWITPFLLGSPIAALAGRPVTRSLGDSFLMASQNTAFYFVSTFIVVGIIGNLLTAPFFRESKSAVSGKAA